MGTVAVKIFLLTVLLSNTLAEICYESECVYYFAVRWERTMTYTDMGTQQTYHVVDDHHRLRAASNSVGLDDPMGTVIGRHVPEDDVITADGRIRRVITINGKFPGPTIEVMENSKVVVHVTNHLGSGTFSLHWHGMHQREDPWQDGVAGVTQCPIAPGQTFTYTFKASPGGTHWYHSHLGNQRQDGMYGALIIHRAAPAPAPQAPASVLIVADWYKHEAEVVALMNKGTPEMPRHMAHMGHHSEHKMLESQIHNVLVNGRGRSDITKDTLPLTTINVTQGRRYRHRLIHSGADFGYKVSVDEHRLTVIASDGFDIEPVTVDSIFIYPGETVDFELEASASSGLFWVRFVEEMLHEAMPGHEHMMAKPNDTTHKHNYHHHHIMDDEEEHHHHEEEEEVEPTVPAKEEEAHHEHHTGHDMDDILPSDQKRERRASEDSMDDKDMDHEGMGHGTGGDSGTDGGMDHSKMDHSNMDHSKMDHSNMDHSKMDHSNMDHSKMGHEGMNHGMMFQEGRAILVYDSGVRDDTHEPKTMEKVCTSESPCVIYNCPSGFQIPNITCIGYNTLVGAASNAAVWKELHLDERAEHSMVLNFMLSGNPKSRGSSVNGRKFRHPHVPFSDMLPLSETVVPCNACVGCTCTHMVDMPNNKVVDIVISNLQGPDQPVYAHHPIHLHGHSFAVLYVGYPLWESGTGWIDSPDILCKDSYCDTVIKSHPHDEKRRKRHAIESHYNLINPPIKDTILVPARGFAVVRIKSDNPGIWFMHCHVDQHLLDGMGLLINSGPGLQKPVPDNFPQCSQRSREQVTSFLQSVQQYQSTILGGVPVWVVASIAIAMVILGIMIAILSIYLLRKSKNLSAPI